jgi:hypothetical protein
MENYRATVYQIGHQFAERDRSKHSNKQTVAFSDRFDDKLQKMADNLYQVDFVVFFFAHTIVCEHYCTHSNLS